MGGAQISVTWTVKNQSTETARGSWTDAVYLSDDGVWDIGDRLLGRVQHTGDLASNGTYTSTLTANIPALKLGQYRIIVRPDIFNEVYEAQFEANNRAASPNVINVDVPEVQLGVPVDLTLSTGQERVYRVEVDEGETLRVRLTTDATGAANEIFVRYGDVPTSYLFDASYASPLQANQTAIVATTKPGVYYILVRGYDEPHANTQARLVVDMVPLAITNVTPDQGGDSRWVTFNIEGARFAEGALVKLVRPGVAELEPVRYEVLDSTHIRAIFDLTDAPHGLYKDEGHQSERTIRHRGLPLSRGARHRNRRCRRSRRAACDPGR